MNTKELYELLQGSYEDACKRLINEEMVSHFVRRFLSDPTMLSLRDAVKEGDIEKSFRAAHTMKGLAANLSFTKLYQAAWNLTEQLRPRLYQADKDLLAALEAEYKRTTDAIEEYTK